MAAKLNADRVRRRERWEVKHLAGCIKCFVAIRYCASPMFMCLQGRTNLYRLHCLVQPNCDCDVEVWNLDDRPLAEVMASAKATQPGRGN